MLLSSLLARGIPARGAITFGNFNVDLDSHERHELLFGKALIDAHVTSEAENWIGILIHPSAWEPYERQRPGQIDAFAMEGAWRRRAWDRTLLLNPFTKIRGGFQDHLLGEIKGPIEEHNAPELSNDLRGFLFLRDKADYFAQRGDFTGRIASKYHATMGFLHDVFEDDCLSWAMKAAATLPR